LREFILFLQGELAGAEAWPYCFSNKVGNDGTREQNCDFHRWRQYLCGDQTLGFDIDYKRLLKEFQGRGILNGLLHRDHRRPGVLINPAADRLARLQRLHGCHQGQQGIHRR